MYLAQERINGETHYFIRESYPSDGGYLSRDLLHLGTRPDRLVEYPGGNAYYVNETVVDSVAGSAETFDAEALEDLFWPFVKPDIRQAQRHFRHRGRSRSPGMTWPSCGSRGRTIAKASVQPCSSSRNSALPPRAITY